MESAATTTPAIKEPNTGDPSQCLAECLDRLANSFESSARRWEWVVYPSILAMFLLGAYGFFMIYQLTHDIARVTTSIAELNSSVDQNMNRIANDISSMNRHVETLTVEVADLGPMLQEMRGMHVEIKQINGSVNRVAHASNSMQQDMWSMNRNISGPLSVMNSFMPWGDSTTPVWNRQHTWPARAYQAPPANRALPRAVKGQSK